VTTEVESPASGILRKILIPEGVEVPILTPVAVIADEKEQLPEKYVCAAVPSPEKKAEAAAPYVRETAVMMTSGPTEIKAPPAARRLAKERGVDLAGVQGSGPGGAILLKDVESFVVRGPQAGPKVLATPRLESWRSERGSPFPRSQGPESRDG